jgi:hypothetical protein
MKEVKGPAQTTRFCIEIFTTVKECRGFEGVIRRACTGVRLAAHMRQWFQQDGAA